MFHNISFRETLLNHLMLDFDFSKTLCIEGTEVFCLERVFLIVDHTVTIDGVVNPPLYPEYPQ